MVIDSAGFGATLSPELDHNAPGYLGALAYVAPRNAGANAGLLTVALAMEGPTGLAVIAPSAVSATSLTDGVQLPAWSNSGLGIAFLHHNPGFGNSLEMLPVFVQPGGITLFEDDAHSLYDCAQVTRSGRTANSTIARRGPWLARIDVTSRLGPAITDSLTMRSQGASKHRSRHCLHARSADHLSEGRTCL